MIYKIEYEERILHCFEAEGDSPEEAEEEFKRMQKEGELSYSFGELVDSEIRVKEVINAL